jgi:type I restriction enzyme S subunit
MSDRDYCTLGELILETKDGDWGQESPVLGYVPYHVIRGADFPSVRHGDISTVPLRYLDAHTVERRTLQPGDIIIETAGGSRDRSTGRTLFITERLLRRFDGPVTCASFARFLRIDNHKADPRFIYWYLQGLHASDAMWEHQVQHTGVARFQYTRFAATHQIKLPERRVQAAIADILSALDDKIAVNDRIIQAAYDLAEGLYRKLANDASQTESVGDVLDLKYGKALPAVDRVEGSVPVYGSGGITGNHDRALVEGPGIIVGRKGTVGAVYWSEKSFFPIDTTFYVELRRKDIPMEFAFYMLKSLRLEGMNSDSAVPGLNRTNALALEVGVPDETELKIFHETVRPLFALREARSAESASLAKLRDTLLPKLMSGEIRVRDAEKVVEDVT